MARTIAEHRKKGTASPSTWVQPVSVVGEVQGQLQVMLAQLAELEDELDRMPVPDPDKPSANRRMTDEDPRVGKRSEVDAKKAEIEAVRAEAEEDLIELVFQVKHSGAWIEWVGEHPPVEGRRLDADWECDIEALALDAMDWVVRASGEPVTADDTAWLHENVGHGDKFVAAQRIAQMQYGETRVPKSLTGSKGVPTS